MIDRVNFNDVMEMWKDPEMWGDTEFKPVSSMKFYDGVDYHGGNDMSVYDYELSVPQFLLYQNKGCISYFKIDRTIRFRGLFVKKEYRGQGISEKLLRYAISDCQNIFPSTSYDFIWALAGSNSTHVHKKVGFYSVTDKMHELPDGNYSHHKNGYMRYDL